ncbi:MAG: hypothetical protein H7832_10235 [Magnetococcus sp. DMHC-6]
MSNRTVHNHKKGMVMLGTALVMLLLITLGAIFTAQVVLRQQRAVNNDYQAIRAAEAAQAGLEWGMAQLSQTTFIQTNLVDVSPQDGWVDSKTWQAPVGLLPVEVGFQVEFANLVVNDFTLWRVSSVGCADGCSPCNASCPIHRRVEQQLQQAGMALFPHALRASLTAKNQVSLTLNAKVTNLYTNQANSDLTVWAGKTVSYSNGAGTVSSLGTQNTASSDPTTKQNDTTLATATADVFFKLFFSNTQAEIKKMIPNIACGVNCNAQLNGVVGKALWVTTNVVLSGINTIGSPSQPVIIITTNDCQISENTIFYGVLYCMNLIGTGTATKVSTVYGGVIVQNNVTVSKVPDVVYDPGVMNQLVRQFGSGTGAGDGRIPGSWRNF